MSTQPKSRKIALIGAAGSVGTHILSSLLASPAQHHIKILTRDASPVNSARFPSAPNITVQPVDYSFPSSITSALSGIEVLIITLSATAPPGTHAAIVNAAAEAGVKWVMPNYYGYGGAFGHRGEAVKAAEPFLAGFGKFVDDVKAVQDKAVNWTALCCGFWYEFSLGMGEAWFGFDVGKRRVTFYDDGLTNINTSTWKLCGDAIAALVSLSTDGLNEFANEPLYVSSFLVSQRDVLDSLHRVLGTSDADWTINRQPASERYEEGKRELAGGNRVGFAKALYAAIFMEGRGDYETEFGVDNGKLGLGREELDEATRRAVEMVEGGFGWKG